MNTSSAIPSVLLGYPARLEPLDASLDDLATILDARLRAFRHGAGPYAPAFDPDAAGAWLREIGAESRHLSAWVASVGRAFQEVGRDLGHGDGPDPDGIWSAEDGALSRLVGEATRAAAEASARGQQDAGAVRRLLAADDQPELTALLQRIASRMADPEYASGFFDQLNADGILALMAVTGPFTEAITDGFARASGSVDLGEERAELVAVSEPREVDALASLLRGDGQLYDPAFLTVAADVVLIQHGRLGHWPGERALPVLEALAANPRAANGFVLLGADRAEALVRPGSMVVVPGASGPGAETADLEERAGAVLQSAFLEAPASGAEWYDHAATVAAFDQLVEAVAEGEVPDIIKQAVAPTVAPFLTDIAEVAQAERDRPQGAAPAELFQRPHVVGFFEELAYDPEALEAVSAVVSAWGAARVHGFLSEPPVPLDSDDVQTPWSDLMSQLGLVAGALGGGIQEAHEQRSEDNAAFAAGLRGGVGLIADAGFAALGVVTAATPMGWAALGLALTRGVTSTGISAVSERARDRPTGLEGMEAQSFSSFSEVIEEVAGVTLSGDLVDAVNDTEPLGQLDRLRRQTLEHAPEVQWTAIG
ncbi:MAG: hypothetical protein ACRD0G_13650 [Acidimicrobiales bacterium]